MVSKFEIWLDEEDSPVVFQSEKFDRDTSTMLEIVGWRRYLELPNCNTWEEARNACNHLFFGGGDDEED